MDASSAYRDAIMAMSRDADHQAALAAGVAILEALDPTALPDNDSLRQHVGLIARGRTIDGTWAEFSGFIGDLMRAEYALRDRPPDIPNP